MKKISMATIILVGLMLPVFGTAQEGTKEVTTLEEVVVTAGRVEEEKKDITTNITVIDEEGIMASSASDLGELLAEKGIGHIQKYPGALTSIGIRSFRTETHGNDLMGHVLILLNGRRAGTGNVAKIMTKNIERVEIIRGPASVQYGSAAMGGVVNVITRKGDGKPKLFVEGAIGSFGYRDASAGFFGKISGIDFSGSFTRDSMDDYYTAEDEKYYNTGYNRKENISLNLGFEFLPRHRIGIIYNYFDANNMGLPGYLSQNDLDDYKDASNKAIDFIYDGATNNETFLWKARYFNGKDEGMWFDPVGSNPDFWDDDIPNKSVVDHQGAQAQISLNKENFLVTSGIDWVSYKTADDTYSPKETKYDNPAYYVLAKTKGFNNRLILTGGLRYDDYEVEVKKGEGGKESDNNLSPSVGIAYLIKNNLKLRANYGEAFRMPSARELAGNYPGWFGNYIGNPELNPEKSKTYEGGVDFYYASFNAGVTFFHTDFKDKIQTISTPEGDTTWENLGEAEMEGIEANLSYDIGSLFSWDLQVKPYVDFTYLNKYKDSETGEDLKYTSDLNISWGIAVSDFDGLSANLNFVYTGKQDIDDWESGWPAPVEEKNGFTVADFTISKKIIRSEKHGGVTVRGEIKNLFNKDYEYVKGYPMPERNFLLSLRYDF